MAERFDQTTGGLGTIIGFLAAVVSFLIVCALTGCCNCRCPFCRGEAGFVIQFEPDYSNVNPYLL